MNNIDMINKARNPEYKEMELRQLKSLFAENIKGIQQSGRYTDSAIAEQAQISIEINLRNKDISSAEDSARDYNDAMGIELIHWN